MALLDRRLKQRMVGAAVLVALVVVFLPMLFNREDEQRRVRVDAPPMPPAPQVTVTAPEPVQVPEPQAEPATALSEELPPSPPVEPVAAVQPVLQEAVIPAIPVAPQMPSRLDADGVPLSWTVQLASLSNRARAEELQRKLRSQGFDAYVRTVDGMNRVFVGPLIERADAERVREQIARQHKLSPIVVRFRPERR